jgi:hypothetical protein
MFNFSSPWSRVFTKSPISAPPVKILGFFMDTEYTSQCLQQPVTGSNQEEFSPQQSILCHKSIRCKFSLKKLHILIILSQAFFMPCPSNSPLFDNPNNMWCRDKDINFVITAMQLMLLCVVGFDILMFSHFSCVLRCRQSSYVEPLWELYHCADHHPARLAR